MLPVCVVIGAGPGVGHAVAKKYLASGYHVALIARDAGKLADMQSKLGSENISVWPLDVSDLLAVQSTFSSIAEKHGNPEVLIFNAYSLAAGKPSQLSTESLAASFQVNVVSALAASQAVIPAMKSAGKGTIIFTGGGFAIYPLSGMTALSIGKAGLRALANCLYQELKPAGIHAGTVTICGIVKPDTPFDPDKIASKFMEFHLQSKEDFVAEFIFDGKS